MKGTKESEPRSVRGIDDATASMVSENREREGVPKPAMAADLTTGLTEDARHGQRDATLVSV